MMSIKIIKGGYGHVENGTVTLKTEKDGYFKVDDDKAKRLLDLGVAICAIEPKIEAEPKTEVEEFEVTREYLEGLKMDKLKDFAEQLGMTYKVGTKKADFIDEIEAEIGKQAEESTEIEEGFEDPLNLDAAEMVQ